MDGWRALSTGCGGVCNCDTSGTDDDDDVEIGDDEEEEEEAVGGRAGMT